MFRDYALYDHAMLRFSRGHKISENFYMRQDGTRVYYFSEGKNFWKTDSLLRWSIAHRSVDDCSFPPCSYFCSVCHSLGPMHPWVHWLVVWG